MRHETVIWDSEPTIGQVASGTSHGPDWHSKFSGTYEGVKASEWDGQPVHFFTNGILGVTPQKCFAFPVGQRDGLMEVRDLG